ncbi:MAG: hypothetical protein ABI891_13700, partial [Acidobacteriota bacterium]
MSNLRYVIFLLCLLLIISCSTQQSYVGSNLSSANISNMQATTIPTPTPNLSPTPTSTPTFEEEAQQQGE